MPNKTKKRVLKKSTASNIKTKNETKNKTVKVRETAISAAIKNISFEKAYSDFKSLKLQNVGVGVGSSAKIGNAVMDYYFFKYRLHTKTKRGVSYYDWIKTRWQKNESEYRMYKFNLAQGKTPEQARYGVFRLYYGSTQGFKPLIAKWLYSLYSPKVAVLDFSAGWGGRCLAAMALGIPYIGIDTNISLREPYNKMVRELQSQSALDEPTKFQVTMVFKDATKVDYSNYDYDMVFTSPPYFKTIRPVEDYPHMPSYTSRNDFNTRFLFPAIQKTFNHLKRGGTFAINIPEDAFQDVRKANLLPSRLHAKHRLFIQPRFAKGNPVHPEKQYKEYIYVWKKA